MKITQSSIESVRGSKSSRRSRTSGGVITDRERQACRWVCEQGVMTVDQLWRAVWWSEETTSPRYAYHRVTFLERAGYLEGLRSPHSLKTYFKATRAAQALAMSGGEGSGLVPLATPPLSEMEHVDGLTEVRLAVLRSNRLGTGLNPLPWRTDRVLMLDPTFPKERFYKSVPDAIWITASGKRIAVEYERTRKVVSRLRSKVEAFSREMARPDRAFDTVLWIASPGTLAGLTQVLESHPGQMLRLLPELLTELRAQREGSSVGGGV